MSCPTFFTAKRQVGYRKLVHEAARGQIAKSGIPNRQNYCVTFYSTYII